MFKTLKTHLTWPNLLLVAAITIIVLLAPFAKSGYDDKVVSDYMQNVKTSCQPIIPPISEQDVNN